MKKLCFLFFLGITQLQAQKYVGIGVDTPHYTLDVMQEPRTGNHPAANSKLFYATGAMNDGFGGDGGVEFRHSNGTQGIGFGYNTIYATGGAVSQSLRMAARGVDGHLLFTTNDEERLRITGAGRVGIGLANPLQTLHVAGGAVVRDSVGIGITTPAAPLHFSNILQNRKIVLWQNNASDHQYFGFGVNPSILRYQVPAVVNSHVFYAGLSEAESAELMRIKGNGNLLVAGKIESEAVTVIPNDAFAAWDGAQYGDVFYHPGGFYKDKAGRVHLRGRIKTISTVTSQGLYTMFKLPSGYYPDKHMYFAAVTEWAHATVAIRSGNVMVSVPSSQPDKWICLDGISYLVE